VSPRPSFDGYRRADGRIGTRNHVLVVPTVICASVVAERIAAAAAPVATALPHLAGCGQLGPDMRVTHDTLAAYCAHPNVGAVVVVAHADAAVDARVSEKCRSWSHSSLDVGMACARSPRPRALATLCVCTWVPGAISDEALPIGLPYLMTRSPARMA